MYQNLHMHTYRCNHATGTDEQYVEASRAAGFTDFGFSDHAPMPDGYGAPRMRRVRMPMTSAEEYVRSVHELNDKNPDLRIRTGFELEFEPAIHDGLVRQLREAGSEYFSLGEHFLYQGHQASLSPTADRMILKDYVDLVLQGAATGDFCVVAHPDVLQCIGDRRIYLDEMQRLCEGLKKTDIPVEINLYGIIGKRHYPNDDFWRIAGRAGLRTVIGSDAHAPELVWNQEAWEKAMEMVDRFGLRYQERVLD